mmetsp:Transcript_33458/g.99671  ORF Transcript_33458/g.99671 Transcript_33458/m.99671 type:complete len:313 (-) Transcript_33458:1241-2179(-)
MCCVLPARPRHPGHQEVQLQVALSAIPALHGQVESTVVPRKGREAAGLAGHDHGPPACSRHGGGHRHLRRQTDCRGRLLRMAEGRGDVRGAGLPHQRRLDHERHPHNGAGAARKAGGGLLPRHRTGVGDGHLLHLPPGGAGDGGGGDQGGQGKGRGPDRRGQGGLRQVPWDLHGGVAARDGPGDAAAQAPEEALPPGGHRHRSVPDRREPDLVGREVPRRRRVLRRERHVKVCDVWGPAAVRGQRGCGAALRVAAVHLPGPVGDHHGRPAADCRLALPQEHRALLGSDFRHARGWRCDLHRCRGGQGLGGAG